MKNYRKVVISMLIAMLLLMLSFTIHADDLSLNVTPSVNSVTSGSVIKLTYKADIELYGATANVKYDDSVLELVDITSSVQWFEGMISSDGKSVAYWYNINHPEVSSKTMFTLHFEVKSGVYSVDELLVRLEKIQGTNLDTKTVTSPDFEWRYDICRNHVWQVVSQTNATCTTDGIKNYKCANCSETKNNEVWEVKLGHDYKDTVVAPTCTEEGYTKHDCTRCTSSYKSDIVEALGHKYEAKGTTTTCGKLGETTYTCSVCQNSYNIQDTEKPAHKYETQTTPSTCKTLGKDIHTCKECGDIKVEDHQQYGVHVYENKITPPTCTEKGKTVVVCSVCGDVSGEYDINETGHSFSEWKIEIAATSNKEGIAKRSCEICEHSETQKLNKLIDDNAGGEATSDDVKSPGGNNQDSGIPTWTIILIVILVIGILLLLGLLIATYLTFQKKREARK